MSADIFTESNETTGLLYDSYNGIVGQLRQFMTIISNQSQRFINSPEVDLSDLSSAIRDFKEFSSNADMIPESIDPSNISQQKQKINAIKNQLDPLLTTLSQLRGKIAFGGNFIRGIIRRPKVYNSDYNNTARYANTNQNLRTINRALDWAEKVLLNVYNLVDQDLNLITLVNAVYIKHHIYESVDIPVAGTVRPVETSLANDQYFKDWFFRTEEFIGVDPDSFHYDEVFTNSLKNSVYGYYQGSNINGIIRVKPGDGYAAISMLFVNPDKEGSGIGTRLMERVMNRGEMRLNVFSDNISAMKLYRRFGFIVVGENVIRAGEGDDDRFVGRKIFNMTRPAIDDDTVLYDAPLPPNRLPDHLLSDEVHMWRAISGIELIHKEPSIDEFHRIWNNWKLMTPDQKKISDGASFKFFGKGNEEHFQELMAEYKADPSFAEDSNNHFIDVVETVRPEAIQIPDIMYFSSPSKLTKIHGRVFLSPHIGIASIFTIDRSKALREHVQNTFHTGVIGTKCNVGYLEWKLPNDQLSQPLASVHMVHNIRAVTGVGSGTSMGYIHAIDVSNIKDQLSLFVTNDADRELIYQGPEPLDVISVQHHSIDWTIQFSENEVKQHGEGYVKFDDSPLSEATDTTEIPPELSSPDVTESDSKISIPKQIDKVENSKNGVKRKELYIAFINYAKRINSKNTFGSIFDKDAFTVTYPFIPDELRYFYRLANPMLCVLEDKLTFFSLSEIRKVNSDNKGFDSLMIFAADTKDMIMISLKDKAIYRVGPDGETPTEADAKAETVTSKLANSFDEYLEQLAGVRIISQSPA